MGRMSMRTYRDEARKNQLTTLDDVSGVFVSSLRELDGDALRRM